MLRRLRLVSRRWRDDSSLLDGVRGLLLSRHHGGGGCRGGGAVNDPSSRPSLSADTARQTTTAYQGEDCDEEDDPNDDSNKFQNTRKNIYQHFRKYTTRF